MKFGYAWTFGEAPAPEKRTPSLPRPPAGLRNSNWAASPRRACFRVLGGFRIRFGYLERPQAPSRPREFHPEPLTDPELHTLASSGSCHRSKAAAFRCMSDSSRYRLAQPHADDPPPPLQPHYRPSAATTRQSAPLRRIGTFGLAVDAACAFSLGIAGKVLTFHIRASVELRAACMPDAVWAVSGYPPY